MIGLAGVVQESREMKIARDIDEAELSGKPFGAISDMAAVIVKRHPSAGGMGGVVVFGCGQSGARCALALDSTLCDKDRTVFPSRTVRKIDVDPPFGV